MTIKEYREKHPNCNYCLNCGHKADVPFERCKATNKVMRKRTAKKCPCYRPKDWIFDPIEKGGAE